MRKTILALIPAAMLFSATSANAASSAAIDFDAEVIAATCDVVTSQSRINLGKYTVQELAGSTLQTPLMASVTPFSISLSNCQAVPVGVTPTKEALLLVQGSTIVGANNMFNNNTTSQIGVMIQRNGSSNYVNNGDKLILESDVDNTDMTNKSYAFTAGLATNTASASAVQLGQVSAAVTFSYYYN